GDAIALVVEILRPVGASEAVEASRKGEVLESFFVGGPQVYALGHIENGFVMLVLSVLYYGSHSSCPYSFNGPHSETDGILLVYGEFVIRFVHIGPQHVQLHPLALLHEEGHLLDVV